MKHVICGSASALLVALPCVAAHAQDNSEPNEIVVENTLLHPSAGLMHDHMHKDGEVMIGVRFERERASGANISGSQTISDAAIHAAGYSTRVASMEMDMVMLDLMYAPSENLTLMVMPHYMWHRMDMIGIDPMAGMDMGDMDMGDMGGHSGHTLPFGEIHSHGTEGFGDTMVSASYRLANRPDFRAHATLGVWIPTGSVDRKNADGTFVHYGMQSGSGTWDVEPSITVSGNVGEFGWGAQASYRWRTEDENASGFAFGDRAKVTGWLSYLLTGHLGATARLAYETEGAVEGHYNGPHNHSAPSDRQENYGGDTLSAGFGLNWRLPVSVGNGPQLGAEISAPLAQDLNGIQAPRDWKLSVAISQTF